MSRPAGAGTGVAPGWSWIPLLASVVLCAAPVWAQEVEISLQRLDVRGLPEVAAYFTVVGNDGRSVLGLVPDEIRVTLDDVEQRPATLTSALAGGERLALALLFDRSGSMRSGLDPAKAAARDFLARLSEGDTAAVIAFDDEATLQTPLTGDPARLAAAVDGIDRGADTALYDAILMGLDALAEAATRRTAIVVLSDGKDTRSRAERGAVIQRARESGVPIYTLGLPVDSDAASLGELAAETGGSYLQAEDAADLRVLYQLIADRLENQYLLRFTSTFGADGAWHRLRVAMADHPSGGETREFLATTGPGISGGRMRDLERGIERTDLARAAGVGALAGALVGVLLLTGVKAVRRDAPVLAPVGFLLLFAATGLGAVSGCLLVLLGRAS